MKTSKLLNILITSALFVCSCSDDLGFEQHTPDNTGRKTIRIGVSLAGNDSRLEYNETDSHFDLLWDVNDTLRVLNPSCEKEIVKFHLVEGAGTSYGEFEGTVSDKYTKGDKLYALYHNALIETKVDDDGNVAINMSNQNGTLNDDFQIMYGETTYNGETFQNFELKHLASILKLTIPTNVTLKDIVIDNAYEPYRTKGTLVLEQKPSDANYQFQTGDIVYSTDVNGFENDRLLKISGTFVPVNDTITVYYYLLETRNYSSNDKDWVNTPHMSPTFTALDENKNVYASRNYFYPKTVGVGKVKEVRSGIFKVANFEGGNGSSSNPYKIANKEQLYSFMLRCNGGGYLNDDIDYCSLSYELTDSIELDNSVYWRMFGFNGTFDGNGYTISGSKVNALFDNLSDAVIRDLTLDLDITFEHYHFTNFGIFATSANRTQIINCVNKSDIDITPHDRHAGVLLGSLNEYSTMIGCANTGDVTITNANYMGGLVGQMNSGAIMEACYNTGIITVETDPDRTVYLGGLVGAINENGDELAVIRSCWTSTGNNITANGIEGTDWFNCYKVDTVPTPEQIAAMNEAMTHGKYMFGTDGTIVVEEPSITLPEIEVEDF